MKSYFICLILLSISLCACREDCGNTSNTSFLNVQFYNIGTSEADTLSFNSIRHEGLDEVLYDSEDNLSVFSLILPNDREEASFLFEGNTGFVNTLKIQYNRVRFFKTRACGLAERIENLSVSETSFDSVRVVSPSPDDNRENINIQIFF